MQWKAGAKPGESELVCLGAYRDELVALCGRFFLIASPWPLSTRPKAVWTGPALSYIHVSTLRYVTV